MVVGALKSNTVTIVGCGLAGCFLAVLLANRGYKVVMYERLSKEEFYDAASKRSYNLVLFGYGITLLKKAGIWNEIKPHLTSICGTITHIANQQNTVKSEVDQKNLPYFTITRAKFAQLLLSSAAKKSTVNIFFNTTLLSVDRHHKTILISNEKTGQISTQLISVLIGADGANSQVRSFMQLGLQTLHTQEYSTWIYKQFVLASEAVNILKLEKNFVHIWTQKKAFITMHPYSNGSLGALLVLPKNDNSIKLNTKNGIKKFIEDNFPDLLPALTEITQSLFETSDGTFATIHTTPWYYKDFITIIGDAAHGFYPFFGQGTTCAFSDAMTLVTLLDKYNNDWGKILPLYQKNRKENADALGELSKEVIVKYLRNKKVDFEAVFDRIENWAHEAFPAFVNKPLSQSILTDPENAAEYRKSDIKQKKLAKRFGIILCITLLSVVSTLIEKNNSAKLTK